MIVKTTQTDRETISCMTLILTICKCSTKTCIYHIPTRVELKTRTFYIIMINGGFTSDSETKTKWQNMNLRESKNTIGTENTILTNPQYHNITRNVILWAMKHIKLDINTTLLYHVKSDEISITVINSYWISVREIYITMHIVRLMMTAFDIPSTCR